MRVIGQSLPVRQREIGIRGDARAVKGRLFAAPAKLKNRHVIGIGKTLDVGAGPRKGIESGDSMGFPDNLKT